ncbi:MAG: URC4/urg3 family protein [Alphaproteobacteria bacterium]|nr:URC4/urg3 family protein [Alphaproteobacteria bacterium]
MPRSRSRQKRLRVILRPQACVTPRNYKASGAVLSASNAGEKPAALLNAAAVRERCEIVFAAVARGEGRYFAIDLARLGEVADRVAAITRRRYPDLAVPYHSRWRHFSVGGVDRAALVAAKGDDAERARARIDLAVVSVLLDAGAGRGWCYHEAETGQVWGRSEGLAVASLRAMQQGLFSTDPTETWRADAAALARVTPDRLAAAFQHRPENPLLGLDSRAALLRRLGRVLAADPARFGAPARPGNLYDYWRAHRGEMSADGMLQTLLLALGPIWPARASLAGVPLGDCGRHSSVPDDGFVPFHKLSQWLVYSLIEPLEAGGVPVTGIDELTGLAEYRNGGLFLDCGVIGPRDRSLLSHPLDPFSEPVVEWRALTVALLDRLAPEVRARLGKPAALFPLACVLEGGSWAAGREIAFEHRRDGSAPITIVSDGTLF